MKTPNQRCPNKKKLKKNQEACIHDIPLALIVQILSFLPSIEAIKTTIIAPTWRNLWYSIPSLEFDMIPFHSNIPNTSIREARERFAGFITKALSQRRDSEVHLQKFKLRFCYRNSLHVRSYVDSWLKILIKCKVVELDLNFQFESFHQNPAIPLVEEDDDAEHYPFGSYSPQFLDFDDSAIKVLKLFGVCFRVPGVALSLKFDSIKEVHLDYFDSSDKDIEHLLAACLNLESLGLGSARGCKNLKIASKKLKYFKLLFFGLNVPESTVEICAPSLVSIYLINVYADKFSLEKTPSLIEAKVAFSQRSWVDFVYWTHYISYMDGVERLTVQNMWTWWPTWVDPPGEEQSVTTIEWLEVITPAGEEFDIPSFISEEFYFKIQPRLEVFSEEFLKFNLKHLELMTGFSRDDVGGMAIMFLACPELASLVLYSKYDDDEDYDDFEEYGTYEDWDDDEKLQTIIHDHALCLPRLKTVEIKDYVATKNQMFVVHLLQLFGAGQLNKITAYPKMVNGRSPPPIVLFEDLDP